MKEIDLDIKSLAYGPVTKYFNKDLWLAHLVWYEEQGYKVYKFDASKWFIIDDFYSDIHDKFEFPGYFGRNWGAVDDLITE
ncbi:MAG: barstar family protein, partial [Pseudomonadota bacterium]